MRAWGVAGFRVLENASLGCIVFSNSLNAKP